MNGKRVVRVCSWGSVCVNVPPQKIKINKCNCKFDPLLSTNVPDDPEKHLNAPVCVPAGSKKIYSGVRR